MLVLDLGMMYRSGCLVQVRVWRHVYMLVALLADVI